MTPERSSVKIPDVDVVVDNDAAQFVRGRGGAIYIWVSSEGLLHVKTDRPPVSDDWERVVRDEIDVFVAPSASDVKSWRVTLVRFPWKRLSATSEMTGGLGQDPSGGIGSGVW